MIDIPDLIRDLHAGAPMASWIDPAILIAQAWAESRHDPAANNPKDPGGRKECLACGALYKLTGLHCPACGQGQSREYRGAYGLFQFLQPTWDGDVRNRHPEFDPYPTGPLEPQQATRGAMFYWGMIRQYLKNHWGGEVTIPPNAILAAYNWGMGNVVEAMPHGWFGGNATLPNRTLSYIAEILEKAEQYR